MSSYKGAKGKAWKAFSDYIRLRDCLKTTGSADHGRCVTCLKPFHYNNIQAGHAIGGRNNSILLHPDLCHGQCSGCNMTGQYARYSIYMIKTYGLAKWEEFVILSKQTRPMKNWQWKEEADKWKQKLKELL